MVYLPNRSAVNIRRRFFFFAGLIYTQYNRPITVSAVKLLWGHAVAQPRWMDLIL